MPEQTCLWNFFGVDNARREKNVRGFGRVRYGYVDRRIRIVTPLAAKAHADWRNILAHCEFIVGALLANAGCKPGV